MATTETGGTVKTFNVTKLLLILGLSVMLCGQSYFGFRLHELSDRQEQIKTDYSDINNITLGVFSIDQWRDKITGIINHQVRNFKLNKAQKRDLQIEVEQIIMALINKAEALLNKKPKSLGGKIKKFAVKSFVKTDDIKAKVPGYAKMIIAKVDNKDNKNKLSDMALSKFSEAQQTGYLDSTLRVTDSIHNVMYKKYKVTSQDELNKKLEAELVNIRKQTYTYCFGMLGCVVIVLTLWWIFRKRTNLHGALFIMSLLFAFILLAVGLTASMVEVDARVRSLDFVLLGEHVVFKNQVLFFQSKSIMDVVHVLIMQPAIDSKLVGALILIFSVLFPVIKLSSTGIHLLAKKKLAENKVIKYFAFQSGKWSMADVIVIAILMVYIGLNGLLESQLAGLGIKDPTLTVITTNNTALQPGYIIFIAFVLFGLCLSTILKFITPHNAD
ncbi:paraquat-inducible protein A [Mucilaginibacter myungsuensis]|uniref:paraquat-inducible protein A n=1 Tax=Mucilaginibacter myungsuensis TaxID=649104 RepID=UPI001D164071|nr:paraquat-inducible protein A [Mucilaginibacter myungsuensis]MDN3597886.1 paraquat-inducible protein A [Mucilaginibacter myungsuensis]